jgi:hypothetical protein
MSPPFGMLSDQACNDAENVDPEDIQHQLGADDLEWLS